MAVARTLLALRGARARALRIIVVTIAARRAIRRKGTEIVCFNFKSVIGQFRKGRIIQVSSLEVRFVDCKMLMSMSYDENASGKSRALSPRAEIGH